MSLRILALDTTGEFGSLAILEDDRVVEEMPLYAPGGFSGVLYEHLARLLARHKLAATDFDCYASASGPGSFTGVRVGLAAVKGLAEAAGKPVAAVSNLRALAWFGSAPLRAVLLDARRGEVYGGVYDAALQPVGAEVVTRFPAWLASLPAGELEFVSADFAPFRAALAGTRFESTPVVTAPRALAGAIARIAAREYFAGRASDPASVDANYVRRADAELFWRDERG